MHRSPGCSSRCRGCRCGCCTRWEPCSAGRCMGSRPPTAGICARTWRRPATPMRACGARPSPPPDACSPSCRRSGCGRSERVAALVREVEGMRGRRRGARAGQGASVPHAAPGLLRGRRAVRRAAHAHHRALPRAQAGLARAADARGPRPRQRAAGAGRPVGRARAVRGAEARRSGRLPARPGAGRGRGRVGRVLRPARLHHDAGGEARASATTSPAFSPTRGGCRAARGYAHLRAAACRAALPGETPTRRLNRALEALVRECPGQYLWSYNRYKTPRGAKPRAGA